MSPVKSKKFIPSKIKTDNKNTCFEPYLGCNNKPVFIVKIDYYFYDISSNKSNKPEISLCCRRYNTVSIFVNVNTPKEAVDYALDDTNGMPNWEVTARDELIENGNYRPVQLFFFKIDSVLMKLDEKYWKDT